MIDWLTHKLDVSINLGFLNKQALTQDAWTTGFRPWQITPHQLVKAIEQGRTYGPVFRTTRKKENFTKCGVISLDFDGDVPADQVSDDPLVQEALTIIYTTASDTPEKRRFRMIFALESPIERRDEWVAATRSLALRLGSDKAATDAARIFHGNSKGQARVYDRGLSNTRIAELIEAGRNAFKAEDSNGRWIATGRSTVLLDPKQLVRRSGSEVSVPLSTLGKVPIHCPKHDDRNASAFVVVSQSGVNGIHCSVCGLTYWPEEETHDFDTFDSAVRIAKDFSLHAKPNWDLFSPNSPSPYKHLFPTQDAVQGIKDASIYLLNDRFLHDIELPKGTSFIKSPKGSGKTAFLAHILTDPSISVLLVGHRRALIRQLCERLNLSCYLDEGVDGVEVNHFRYGVCLDSLSKARDIEYDYVVVDESEQVLAHFLSDTMEDKRNSVVYRLRRHISKAKRVVALDADLGWTTFRFFSSCPRSSEVSKDTCIFLNEHSTEKNPVQLYDSKHHLVGEIHQAVARGERCYITSNSKTLIKSLFSSLSEIVPNDQIIQITGENSQQPEAQEFLSNVREKAKGYRVILTSPSVSTGVDISFEDDEQVFDHVFGVFEALICTHFECDQQLLRVRNPKQVSVYLTPAVFGFETNLDVVEADLLVERLMEMLIDGYSNDGPVFRNHPILDLACSVVSTERASKNNLKRNFIAYKRRQKYPTLIIPADPLLAVRGKDQLQFGQDKVDAAYVAALTSAPQLSSEEIDLVKEQMDSNEAIPDRVRASFDRTLIELIYRQPISADLIFMHDRGRFARKVETFEDLIEPEKVARRSSALFTADLDDPLLKVTSSHHFRVIYLQKALLAAGLWDGKRFIWTAEIDTRDLTEFIKFVSDHKAQFESQFNSEVYKDLTTKPVSQLNTLLGFAGLNMKKIKKRIVEGDKRITRYEWDMEKVSEMEEISKRRSSYPNPWLSPPFAQN